MWWFWLVVILAIVFWLLLRTKPKRIVEAHPNYTISVETRTSTTSDLKVGYETNANNDFVIGPKLPFPVTLHALDSTEVTKLVAAYEQHNDYEIRSWFAYVVAQKNASCKELDDWASVAKPKLDAHVNKLILASNEWAQASELDKEDLLTEMRNQAIGALDVRPANLGITWTLLLDEPLDLTVDDALLTRFKDSPDTYQLLLRVISGGTKVQVAQADDYRRKAFEELHEKGFMLRGQEIDVGDILMGITMKQMQEIAGADAPRKFTRKAQAADFLKGLPDIWQRLEKSISFRELFQLKPMEGLDMDEIAKAHAYSSAVANVIMGTIRSSINSQRKKDSHLDEFADGWSLDSENCCPSCQTMHGKTWKRLPQKLPPFHIGCEARIYSVYGDDS